MASDIGTDRAVARLVGGRYQITGLIASGGMGEVYQAHDKVLDRTVALKVLRAALGPDPDPVERFRKEATAAGRLSHPNIVQVYDWGKGDDGSAFMAMEYVEGQNLREVLAANRRLRPSVAARIATQVCDALEHARKAGLVHRDIKPENILVTPEGRVKVTDFGLSRTMAESRATKAGVLLGTAHYLAPEQVEGKEVDHRADLYALGCVLYEMLTGQTPFSGDTPVAVASIRVREDVPAPSAKVAGTPKTLDEIVRRATARVPAKRYPTANEMGEAIRAAVQRSDTGEVGVLVHPTQAIPIGTHETVDLGRRRFSGLTRRRMLVLGLIVILLAGGIPLLVGTFARAEVPSVAGQSKAEAQASLKRAGFRSTIDFEHSRTVTEGTVIRTDPPGGRSARRGSTIKIVISQGPVKVEVPDVRGTPYVDAQARLTALGLEVQRVDVFHQAVPKDAVVDQDKQPSVLVNQGTTITLSVSKGKESLSVPGVTGKSEAEATQILTQTGFVVATQHQNSETVARGLVISQTPGGGAKADRGSTITIVVSDGPPLVTVPSVRCMSQNQAADVLASKGFKVQFSGSGKRVVDQDPGPGNQAPKGSTVTAFLGPGTYC